MITAIEIENFKAFGSRQRIELKPITLLFGPNSGGKSSILHAIHYARELFLRGNADVHRTESGGEFIDLGGLRRMIHGRRWGEQMKLKIDLELDGEDLPDFASDVELTEVFEFDPESITSKIHTAWVELTIGGLSDPHIVSYAVGINGEKLATISSVQQDRFVKLVDIHWKHPIFLSEDELKFAQLASDAERMRSGVKDVVPEVAERAESLRTEAEQEVRGALVELFEQTGDMASSVSELQVAMAPPTHLRRALPAWDRALNIYFPSGELSLSKVESDSTLKVQERAVLRVRITEQIAARATFVELMSKLIVGVGQYVRDQLDAFRYVGPLRTIPTRHRDVIDPVGPSRWANGLAAWELLNEWGESLRKQVSHWMWSDDRLATGYQIERLEYKEISNSLQNRMMNAIPDDDDNRHGTEFEKLEFEVQDIPEHSKVVLFDLQKNLRLDPHDVGVGITQVVPVVVAVLAADSSVVAIEQPELHLHPKCQAALGDVLIAGAVSSEGSRNQLIVETHSEHMILRLLRRIRETTRGEATKDAHITPADISILYVAPGEGESSIIRMGVNDKGEFLRPWPDTFFSQDFFERTA